MSDRRYWVMRTDPDNRDVLLAELRAGRLRQGWGYEPHLHLNIIAAKLERHDWRVGELEEDERACWRGNQRMWPGHYLRALAERPGDGVGGGVHAELGFQAREPRPNGAEAEE